MRFSFERSALLSSTIFASLAKELNNGTVPLLEHPKSAELSSGSTNSEGLFLIFLFGFRFCFSFAFSYCLSFCSTNFRKERLGCGWSCHLAQQQSPSCDIASINRVPGIIVLAD